MLFFRKIRKNSEEFQEWTEEYLRRRISGLDGVLLWSLLFSCRGREGECYELS